MKDVVIVSGVRLPVGSYGGSLKDITAIDMASMVLQKCFCNSKGNCYFHYTKNSIDSS